MKNYAFGYGDYENVLMNEDGYKCYPFEITYDADNGLITLIIDLYKPAPHEEWNVDEWEKQKIHLCFQWLPGCVKAAVRTASRIARSFINGREHVQVGGVTVRLNDLRVLS